jgi:hypothetical protein
VFVAVLSMAVVPIFIAGDTPRSKGEWAGTFLLGIFLFQFFNVLTKKVIFRSEDIEYRRFFTRRRYDYSALRSVSRTFEYNLVIRFAFVDGKGFTLDANFVDMEFLEEILRQRSPTGAASLLALR